MASTIFPFEKLEMVGSGFRRHWCCGFGSFSMEHVQNERANGKTGNQVACQLSDDSHNTHPENEEARKSLSTTGLNFRQVILYLVIF